MVNRGKGVSRNKSCMAGSKREQKEIPKAKKKSRL